MQQQRVNTAAAAAQQRLLSSRFAPLAMQPDTDPQQQQQQQQPIIIETLNKMFENFNRQQQQREEHMVQRQQEHEAHNVEVINTNIASSRDSIQSELHGIRQQQQTQQQQVSYLLTKEQQKQKEQQQEQQEKQERQQQHLKSEPEEAARWSAETVADAPFEKKNGCLVLVASSSGAPALTKQQAAAALGAAENAVTQHNTLPGHWKIDMGTETAAQQKIRQWRAGGAQHVTMKKEKTDLGVQRTAIVVPVKERINEVAAREGLGVTAYTAPNSSNVFLTAGTAAAASAGKAESVQYPVWRHGKRGVAGGKETWEKTVKRMDRVPQYLAEVLPSLSPAAAAKAAAAAAAGPASGPTQPQPPASTSAGPAAMQDGYVLGLRSRENNGSPRSNKAQKGGVSNVSA